MKKQEFDNESENEQNDESNNEPVTDQEFEDALTKLSYEVSGNEEDGFEMVDNKNNETTPIESTNLSDALCKAYDLVKDNEAKEVKKKVKKKKK